MKRKILRKLYKAILLLAAGLWIGLGTKTWALPGVGQLPGHGIVASGTVNSYTNVAPPAGFSNAATLNVSGNTAILWGSSGGTLNVTGSGPGFNVGQGAKLFVSQTGSASLLNVDTTGNPSYIMGSIQSTGGYFFPIYIANGSGVVVGPNASITFPGGIGILGYDLSSQASGFSVSGSVSVAPTTAGSSVTIQSGATLNATESALLIAAPTVNVGIATPTSLLGTFGHHPVSILSGYSFTGYYAYYGTFTTGPTPISNATSGATAGSITLSGPSSGSFTFPIGSFLLSSGSITTSGKLVLPGGGDIQWGLGYGNLGMWQGWLYNYGTITFSQLLSPQTVGFHGSLSNWGTILGNPSLTLPGVVIWVTGSIINNSGAIMNGGGTNVHLWAQQGALINKGTISGYDFVDLFAQNPGGLNSQYPLGSVYNSGVINITSPTASTDSFTNPGNLSISLFAPLYPHQLTAVPNINLWASSATGNVFFVTGGAVNTADPGGLHAAALSAASFPLSTFYLNIPITSQIVSFKGGNLTGGGVLTTEEFHLTTAGDVRNVVSSQAILNGFHIANGNFGNTTITLNLDGVVPQIINLAVNGDASINSGGTSTFLHSVFSPPVGLTNPVPNEGGNLLVNASGNLTVTQINGFLPLHKALSTNILHLGPSFIFPGGIALKAGGTLSVNVPIDNGYTAVAGPNFQGIFLSAPSISVAAPFVTSGNTVVHTSLPIPPVTVYDVTAVSPLFPTIYTANPSPGKLVVSPFPFQ
ncbi:hypothetical protein [Candidatus Methylacidiphilum infernorum]|uniref:Large exoprotein involved in heme utilization or adhesion n=1 Tax=Methylacidiphilum infernorum (isolate V4) TaxID=481448 RepID=B3DZ34_METI4|nr:hypothetical protein [Candidatus Methylacidiphilum infernorum]ACD84126.1 Conserved hypothetical protein [Methylacidiphilum infernorum V4]